MFAQNQIISAKAATVSPYMQKAIESDEIEHRTVHVVVNDISPHDHWTQ